MSVRNSLGNFGAGFQAGRDGVLQSGLCWDLADGTPELLPAKPSTLSGPTSGLTRRSIPLDFNGPQFEQTSLMEILPENLLKVFRVTTGLAATGPF